MPRGHLDPARRYRVIPLAVHAALIADRAEGLSVPRIADKYGFTPSAIQNFFYTHGIKPPPTLERKTRKDAAIPPDAWAAIAARYQAGEKAKDQATRDKMAETQARLMAAGGTARRVSRLEDDVAAWLDAQHIAYERQVSLKLLDGPRKRWRVADFRLANGSILEVYGTFWHCDPRVYAEPVSAIQVRHQSEDADRARLYSGNGLRWTIVWENDFRSTPDAAMTHALQELLGSEVR